MWWNRKRQSSAIVVYPRYTAVVGSLFQNFANNARLLVILEENAIVVVCSSNMSAKEATDM